MFVLDQLHVITSVTPETPHEQWFQDKFGKLCLKFIFLLLCQFDVFYMFCFDSDLPIHIHVDSMEICTSYVDSEKQTLTNYAIHIHSL